MRLDRVVQVAGALLAPVLAAGGLLAGAPSAFAAAGDYGASTLYVSRGATSSGADHSCRTAAYSSIQSAVDAAGSRAMVVVCRGIYHEQVVIGKALTLRGIHATISETGVTPTAKLRIPGRGQQTIYAAVLIRHSHVAITGLRITDAIGEGILAVGLGSDISRIWIGRDMVVHNDLGGAQQHPLYFECQAQGGVPGDCGEGVHFTAVSYSDISGNVIKDNSGGVLLSDDTGPTHNNVVAGNTVTRNSADCGITLPGHNTKAVSSTGRLRPRKGGVFDNVIQHNIVTDNGRAGEGAGVLFANASAGTASYDNVVTENYIAGNGLSGVTFHAHITSGHQYLSGNVVTGNIIGKNNLDGDTLDSPASPTDPSTTGVLVYSGGTQVTVVIADNHIFDNKIGIWLSRAVTAKGLLTNVFFRVGTPISGGH